MLIYECLVIIMSWLKYPKANNRPFPFRNVVAKKSVRSKKTQHFPATHNACKSRDEHAQQTLGQLGEAAPSLTPLL